MYTMGVDIGSASSKAVILKDGKDVLAAEVVQVGTGSTGPKKAMEMAFEKSGVKEEEIDFIIATGYGRFSLEDADKQMSEISCHAKGIYHLVPTARTIIDIGGQDAKAIRLDNKGGIKQFFMMINAQQVQVVSSRLWPEYWKQRWMKWQHWTNRQRIPHQSAVLALYSLNPRLFLSSPKALTERALPEGFTCP